MKYYQQDFIEQAIAVKALKFGDFTLKSGRTSNYYFNMGQFNTGSSLSKLAPAYAQRILDSDIKFDMLFGPAYIGIPLVSAIAMELYNKHKRDYPFCFNRKESLSNNSKQELIGAPLRGRVLIIDDVLTVGTSLKKSINLIESKGAKPSGAIVALDRQELGESSLPAITEIQQDYGIKVISIIQIEDIPLEATV